MTTDIQHIDVDSEDFENAPRALRDYAKKLQKAFNEQQKVSDGYRTQLTEKALGDVLAAQKFTNPKRVQRDLLADNIDPLDGDAVAEWLQNNAGDYAKGEGAPAADEPKDPDYGHQQAERDRLNVGDEFREPASLSKVELVASKITADMTQDDVARLYRENGL